MIRSASEGDAERIVRIHLNSWRSTYSNVFPKEVFDKQESEYNTRVENIKNAIEKGSSNYALLEEDNMVKAFICHGDARGDKYKEYKEIYSIYIEDNNQKKGYGTKLIKYCFDIFKKEGYITNSFHRSSGFIYNRENMHLSLGNKLCISGLSSNIPWRIMISKIEAVIHHLIHCWSNFFIYHPIIHTFHHHKY